MDQDKLFELRVRWFAFMFSLVMMIVLPLFLEFKPANKMTEEQRSEMVQVLSLTGLFLGSLSLFFMKTISQKVLDLQANMRGFESSCMISMIFGLAPGIAGYLLSWVAKESLVGMSLVIISLFLVGYRFPRRAQAASLLGRDLGEE